MDADPVGLCAVARFYGSHGVTSYLPTTWTAPRDAISKALQAIAEVGGRVEGGATILGAHLEGPYLNAANAGAQDARFIRPPDREEVLGFLDTGVARRITLAPENDEGLWLTGECCRRGIAVSAGHTSATYEQVAEAARNGLGQVTHCFNQMGLLHHRQPGTVGAALDLPEIACELIADGVHIHPAVMRILVEVKGPERVILVTDALRWAGSKEGTHVADDKFDNRQMIVNDGAVRLADGTLAGSTLTMEKALQNITRATGKSIAQLWPASSLNAARALGITSRKGSLEVGKDADLVLLDAGFNVRLTVAEGEIIHRT
jgi:N-acetylglucosamine-6-phosphate deacetylase